MNGITLKQANGIIVAALAAARTKEYKPMAVVVLDESGNVRAVQREDGASMFRVDIATGKAWASVAMTTSSRKLGERAKENPNFYGALAASSHGKFLPTPGAVLIKNAEGEVLGATGASGGLGDEDELICMTGIEAVGLKYA
ncbi:MAG TPA: heme-binding protein [Steroidobacteraceae bacterium]|nr:heme-binding protein [Steroidobacteraceae bacterium]